MVGVPFRGHDLRPKWEKFYRHTSTRLPRDGFLPPNAVIWKTLKNALRLLSISLWRRTDKSKNSHFLSTHCTHWKWLETAKLHGTTYYSARERCGKNSQEAHSLSVPYPDSTWLQQIVMKLKANMKSDILKWHNSCPVQIRYFTLKNLNILKCKKSGVKSCAQKHLEPSSESPLKKSP